MAGYLSTPISIKKYIKVPPRKLISGFLHINVVSHEDNDAYEDAYTYYRDEHADGDLGDDQLGADPWRQQAASVFDASGRTGKKLSFGDYDCLLFWVAGGMTLQDPIMGDHRDNFYLAANGFSDQTVNAWYTSIDDYCQNFIKYDLISRINNGYGHAALMNDTLGAEVYHGTVAITRNEFRSDEAGISAHDCTVTPPDYDTAGGQSPNVHGGNFQKHIMSCGSFSHQSSATSPNGEDLNDANKNTFFPPVQSVEVYGQHYTNIVSQTNSGASETLYSINDSGGYHSKEFWNLVIDIKLRGFEEDWDADGSPRQADLEWFKSRTNVFFQPFGETASFLMSDTAHTS